MEVFQAYSYGTSGYLALQAIPLLITPRSIVSLLATQPRSMTDLEAYLSRSLGLALVALALLFLLFTGAIPLASPPNSSSSPPAKEEGREGTIDKSPLALPALVVSTAYHALSAFYLYTQMTWRFSFGFGSGLVGSTALFCVGVWVLLFGGEKARISKKTGADKRTSNFPFANAESAKAKKKESKRKTLSSRSR